MAARRSRGRAADENRSITPDQPGRDSPRSRKCLDKALKGSMRASPLMELNREAEEEASRTTPAKRRPEDKQPRLQLSSSPPPPSPDLIPKTPTQAKPRFSATNQMGVPRSAGFLTPQQSRHKKRGSLPSNIPDQFRQAPPSTRKAAAQPPSSQDRQQSVEVIAVAAFYGRRSDSSSQGSEEEEETATVAISKPPEVYRLSAVQASKPMINASNKKPSGSSKSISRRQSSGGGAVGKRKRGGGLGSAGVSHAIKRPKKRPRIEPVKISELPAMSIEIPKAQPSLINTDPSIFSSPSVAAISPGGDKLRKPSARTPSSATPKTGNFCVSKGDTRVDVEVTGGQIIYRKKSKIGTTPLRRSPRKNISPLKQNYLAGRLSSKGGHRRSGGSQKLFSPLGPEDYLAPPPGGRGSPRKFIPSPVKFRVAPEEEDSEETDFSQLIENLVDEEEQPQRKENSTGDSAYTVFATEEELANTMAQPPGVPSPPELDTSRAVVAAAEQFVDDTECAQAALQAVNDILGAMDTDLPADTMVSSSSELTTESDPEVNKADGQRLFPIFYKSAASATPANGDVPIGAKTQSGRRLAMSRDQSQMQIDAGQERGPTLCLTCGTVYSKGDPADEANHESLHNGVLERLRFPGWRQERVGGVFGEGRVVVVQPGDPPHMWRKVEETLLTVDRDLGFSEVGIRAPEKTKAFLFISQKRIVGLLLAEAIQHAYKMVQDGGGESKVPMCSEESLPVKCGISRIWVLPEYRRKRVASSLVDTMRLHFILGHHLGQLDFAFSDPTINGYDFAASYLKRSDFLVYNR